MTNVIFEQSERYVIVFPQRVKHETFDTVALRHGLIAEEEI